MTENNPHAQHLLEIINDRSAIVGIIGLGYVGLPLALAFTEKGFKVLGFDVDPIKVDKINKGDCYIKHLDPTRLKNAVRNPTAESAKAMERKRKTQDSKSRADAGDGNSEFRIPNSEFDVKGPRLQATNDFSRLSEPDAVLICVPTPLGSHKEPDLQYVEASARAIRDTLRPGQLIILESTTYPGTTDDLLRPILEDCGEPRMAAGTAAPQTPDDAAEPPCGARVPRAGRADGKSEIRNPKSEIEKGEGGGHSEFRIPNSEFMKCGTHFFLAFSPEREDPGNKDFGTTNVPKVVGGVDEVSGDLAQALYDQIIDSTIRVASARIAEASKLTENIFRSVNIALVNELKIIYDRLGIDIWEVLDAAETKPFGFMRFNPGPGLGGHCIIGSEWLRVRGCGLAGLYRAEDLFRIVSRRYPAAVTRNGVFVEPEGLEALALDAKSSEVDWFPVTTLYRGKFSGDGIRLSTSHGGDLTVTDEHPMFVSRAGWFETVSAINLSKGDRLPVVTEDNAAGPTLTETTVTAIEHVAINGWVYSMEVEGAGAFTTSSGIGVHNCIPLDPFYLAWRAREAGVPTRFIELAGEINTSMPGYVIEKLQAALNENGRAVKGARIMVLGLAYKPDIDDPRESPAFEIIERLLELGAEVSYHDPHIPVAPKMRSWPDLPAMKSTALSAGILQATDGVILVTNHKAVDYDLVLEHAPLIIDTRGVYRHHKRSVRSA